MNNLPKPIRYSAYGAILLVAGSLGLMVLAFILGMFVALVSYFTGSTNTEAQTVTPTPVAVSSEKTWHPGVRNMFLSGCMEDDESLRAYCSCATDYMEEYYTEEQAAEMGVAYGDTGEFPDEILDAASACYHLIPGETY